MKLLLALLLFALTAELAEAANRTTDSYAATALGGQVTIPAGTAVKLIRSPTGITWAVDDTALLNSLTGNTYDPTKGFVLVPANIVGLDE